ncbi:hypothetical protein [Sphingomonas sp. M1-B02]|uniref:hypothetical protein n=1 Tax=Sphingomonas sp. M1-B02 TaxID=3114300 RepID=UPI00223EBD9D|nr:hypothetical protein [Sphingomonas sp. S6-11]UZK64819.1 hypothetical protein OKW87_09760 [Sphingomonas sp. S6-11]
MKIALLVFAALLAMQGLAMLFAPRRFAALELWKYRVIGARPAEPGNGTFLLYRIMGAAVCTVAAFLLFQFVSE